MNLVTPLLILFYESAKILHELLILANETTFFLQKILHPLVHCFVQKPVYRVQFF